MTLDTMSGTFELKEACVVMRMHSIQQERKCMQDRVASTFGEAISDPLFNSAKALDANGSEPSGGPSTGCKDAV